MTELELLRMAIPISPCQEGCLDCCCPVPFSLPEWAQVPLELKAGLDVRRSKTVFGRPLWVPFRPGFLPDNFSPFVAAEDLGRAMRGGTDKEKPGSCPFASVERGCMIYEQRPILCRLFGTTMTGLLACKKGLSQENLLTAEQVMNILTYWNSL